MTMRKVRDEHRDPVRVDSGKGLFIAMLVAGVLIIGLVANSIATQVADNKAICERNVTRREDNRAMWLATFDAFPDSEEIQNLRVTLEEVLPRLTCPPGREGTLPTDRSKGDPTQ